MSSPGLRPEILEELDPVVDAETWYKDNKRTVAFVRLNGVNRATVNHGSDTTYKVIAGAGIVDFPELNTRQYLFPGTIFEAKKDTVYRDAGWLLMIATSTPPLNPDLVEVK